MSDRRTCTAVLEVEASALSTRAAGDDRLPIALSSEHPVERIDYVTGARFLEVLDHSAGAVDLTRAQQGLPFLLSHDDGDQFGIVEDVRVGSDKKLRGMLRFSRGQRAQEIRRDVEDGIRRSVSIGYAAGDQYVSETTSDGRPVRRFTRWMPYEVSTVAIPADPTVGIHRSARPSAPSQPGVTVESPSPTVTDVRSRAETIYGFAASAGLSAREADVLVASGRDLDSIGRELLGRMHQQHTHSTGTPTPALHREFLDAYSEALFAPEGQTARNTTRSLAKELGINSRGSLVPLAQRAFTSTGVGTGKELSPILQGDIVDLMRPRMIAAEFGARAETYVGGTVSRPTISADASFTWLAENPGAGVSATDPATGAITMVPRAVAVRTSVTAQSIRTSSPESAFQIMESHAARLAVAMDAAVLAGTGASNQPTGILYNSGANLVAMGTNGGTVSYAKLCELEQAIDAANAPMQGLGFVTTPQIRSRMRQTQDFPSAAAGRPLWDATNTVLGHRAMTTTSMPSTLTKGTSSGNCHAAILGDFSQVVMAYWGALEVIVDPYTDAAKGLTHITSTLYVDVGILQPSAFAVIRDLTLA